MRIIFAGTPETAVPSFHRLRHEHDVIAVLTRAPAPVGRKRVLTPSPVHRAAEEVGIPVLTPRSLRDPEVIEQIRQLAPEAVAVVAYGLIIPPEMLSIPTHGWINLHYSLLPRWRGAAPVQYALAAGDAVTGTSVFQIEAGLDTGPVFDMATYELHDQTAGEVLDELSDSGAEQLARVLAQLAAGTAHAQPQEGDVTLAPQLSRQDAFIDFSWPAEVIAAHIRGFTPHPGPWTHHHGQPIKLGPVRVTDETGLAAGQISGQSPVLVGTGSTAVELTEVIRAGKKRMAADAWVRGLAADRMTFDVEGKSL